MVLVFMGEGDFEMVLMNFYNEMLMFYYWDDGIEVGCLVYVMVLSSVDMFVVKLCFEVFI